MNRQGFLLWWRRRVWRCAAAALCAAGAAQAQEGEQRAQSAQFVLLIDDSGSMADFEPHSDPNRLAVFAARSVLALFDDRDEVSVVRLNATGGAKGAAAEPLEPIQPMTARVRQRYDEMLSTDPSKATIAKYAGPNTSCAPAFDAVKGLLNAARREKTRQVFIYLTDGKCEDPQPLEQRLKTYTKEVESAKSGDFAFYVLHFVGKGNTFSPSLGEFAERTGGRSFDVKPDPTGILRPLARAISQAQGFDALEVTPQDARIAAHSTARRVRLLAVVEGADPPLEIGFLGAKPNVLGSPRGGVHQYPGQRAFRFAAVDYAPIDGEVKVEVKNGEQRWGMVAIPEYRVRLETRATAGPCSQDGPALGDAASSGRELCLRSKLVNHEGRPVDKASFGRVGIEVRHDDPTAPGSRDKFVPLNLVGKENVVGAQTFKLAEGHNVFHPRVSLTFDGGTPVHIDGAPVTILGTNNRITSVPSEWRLDGTLVPGETRSIEITLGGGFAAMSGTFKLRRADGLPSCVHAELGGVEEGGQVHLADGQKYRLSLRVDTLCWVTSKAVDLVTDVVITPSGPAAQLALPVTGKLEAKIELPESITITAQHGKPTSALLGVKGNHRGEIRFEATLGASPAGWPGAELSLGLAPATIDGGAPEGALAAKGELLTSQGGASKGGALLWATATPCCAQGRYTTSLSLQVPGAPGEVRNLPVIVEAGPVDWWACHGVWVKRGLVGVTALLLLWMLRNVIKNTHWVSIDRWEGGKRRYLIKLPSAEVEGVGLYEPQVLRRPSVLERAQNWLACGGLATAFGRRAFLETMRVENLRRDTGDRLLYTCDLKLDPFDLVPLDMVGVPHKQGVSFRDPCIIVRAQPAGPGATFLWLKSSETTMEFLDPEGGVETYLVNQEVDPAEDPDRFQLIRPVGQVDKLGRDGKRAKKPAISILF